MFQFGTSFKCLLLHHKCKKSIFQVLIWVLSVSCSLNLEMVSYNVILFINSWRKGIYSGVWFEIYCCHIKLTFHCAPLPVYHYPEKTANISWWYWFPWKMMSEKWTQKSLPRSGSCFWLVGNLLHPIRSSTYIGLVTHH